MDISLSRATASDVDDVARLFDQYRCFYGQADSYDEAREFIASRIGGQDSVIFLARYDETAAGFTQLYPSYSSVAMRRIWILNDLFVAASSRRCGVAHALINEAVRFARDSGAARLALATAVDNGPAQSLYEKLGWSKDEHFLHYTCSL